MNKLTRYIIFTLIDTFIVFFSVLSSYLILYEKTPFWADILPTFLLFWSTFLGGFYYTKLYSRVWRYASIGEITLIIKSSITPLFIVFGFHFILNQNNIMMIPTPMLLLTWMMIILSIFGSRFLLRILREKHQTIKPNKKRTLIVGSGDAGILVVKELKNSIDSPLYPVAFIDDNPNKFKLQILDVPVVGSREDIITIVEQYHIDIIIIAIPSISREEMTTIITICKKTSAQIKILPRISDIINGRFTLNMIREVKVEDLLGRSPIKVNLQEITGYVTNKVVLVTGAGGSIGSEICQQIAKFNPKKLLLLGHGENSIYTIENELKRLFPHLTFESTIADIQDKKRIETIFTLHQPDVVYHAAAHKHVPLMENNPTEAIKNNIIGTKNVAECAHQLGIERFVLISTDKAVNPTSVMGVTKRIAEMIIQNLGKSSKTKFTAVRFGNVLGSRGSVIPLFKQQIKEGGPVTVTHPDMVRYFMTIPEAVQLVIQAGALTEGGEIFILDMGRPVKISDLARDLISLSGLEPDKDIKIVYTGIRPGEKLYEELLTSEEGITASKHQLIYVAKPVDISNTHLQTSLKQLEQLTQIDTTDNVINDIKIIFHQLVPTYQTTINSPNHH